MALHARQAPPARAAVPVDDPRSPVVVAVGCATDGRAVEWAAAEASARRCPLHVVHAENLRWTIDPTGLVPVADLSTSRAASDVILRAAVNRARGVASDLDISTEALVGCTARLLARETRRAQLLVLGGGGALSAGVHGHLGRPLLAAVARRAACPVTLVRSLHSGTTSVSPRVVVCADGAGEWMTALGVALGAAERRGLPVVAVHGGAPGVPADSEAAAGSAPVGRACAPAVLDRALERWRHRFADVPVSTGLLVGEPVPALLRESQGAALLVIGFRARAAARDGGIGALGRAAVGRAQCPVAVVRSARAGRAAPPAPGGCTDGADPAHDGMAPVRRRDIPWR